MTGNFHPNGDVDRRSEEGRGLESTVRMYESRIISLVQHLELNKSHNTSLQFVAEQEQNDIVRLKEKLLEIRKFNANKILIQRNYQRYL